MAQKAHASWEGVFKEGKGKMNFTGYEGPFTYKTRFEEEHGTNPEQLIGAALAGCFSMALSANLEKAGFANEKIETDAAVTLRQVDGHPRITKIDLTTKAKVPGISEEKFHEIASAVKESCPISAALAAVPEITLDASLV